MDDVALFNIIGESCYMACVMITCVVAMMTARVTTRDANTSIEGEGGMGTFTQAGSAPTLGFAAYLDGKP